jgi:hypothetical protein
MTPGVHPNGHQHVYGPQPIDLKLSRTALAKDPVVPRQPLRCDVLPTATRRKRERQVLANAVRRVRTVDRNADARRRVEGIGVRVLTARGHRDANEGEAC